MWRLLPLIGLLACNPDPSDQLQQQVEYRDGLDGGPNTGERGTVKITEMMWTGSVTNDGVWDVTDQFIEIRNEGARPMNLSRWHLLIEGTAMTTLRVPETDIRIGVGDYLVIATKNTGCFPEPDIVMPELKLPYGDPFRVTLRDADEHLIEPAGDKYRPPFAGTYDGQVARSMEKIELMFGGRGSEPNSWHHYTDNVDVDVPNNTGVAENCRVRTMASPGAPNSPDYSGAYSSGGLD